MVSAMASRDPEARPVTEGASLPGRRLLHETVRLYDGTRRLRDQHDRVVSLSDEVGRLRYALQRSARR